MEIQRALLSVSDKDGVAEFAAGLYELGIELLSTGGTAEKLRGAGLPVTEVSDYTGFPACFDGRLKTIHPKIHGGFLYIRGNPEHEARAKELGILPIDLVVVNLYPFQETIAKGATVKEAVEQIDIGGPAMVRGAAKNHIAVTVVCDPGDYEIVLQQIRDAGNTYLVTRARLAAKAYRHTGQYDLAIGGWLEAKAEEYANTVFP